METEKEKVDEIEQNIRKQDLFKMLIGSVNDLTEEVYRLRQKEVELMQKLLDSEQVVTYLISELAKKYFGGKQK